MEDIIFILLAVGWLIFSLYKKQQKQKPGEKPASQAPGDQPQPQKKERGFETIFRELVGEEDVATESKPAEAEVVEQQDVPQVQHKTTYMQEKEEESGEYEKHLGETGVGDDFEFSAEGKIETIEDQVKKIKHQKEEEVLEVVDLWEENEDKEPLLWEFDPRLAIIYSEIINKKY